MKVLVFGAGGVGSVYTYILDAGGAKVAAVCRSNYESVKQNGFKITSDKFGEVEAHPQVLKSTQEAAEYGPWDYIFVSSKATPGSRPTTAEILKPAVGPNTAIIIAQNGIGIEDEYKSLFPDNAIISAVVYVPATQEAPGFIYHSSTELTELGLFPADDPVQEHKRQLQDFVAMYNSSKGNAKIFDDIQPRRWSKLISNGAWSPLCALSMLDGTSLCESSPGAADLVLKVMIEVTEIAQAKGYKEINSELAKNHFDRVTAERKREAVSGRKEPSMLTDVRMGRPIEVEVILGIPTRIAKELGVETPLLDLLYLLAKARNDALIRDLKN